MSVPLKLIRLGPLRDGLGSKRVSFLGPEGLLDQFCLGTLYRVVLSLCSERAKSGNSNLVSHTPCDKLIFVSLNLNLTLSIPNSNSLVASLKPLTYDIMGPLLVILDMVEMLQVGLLIEPSLSVLFWSFVNGKNTFPAITCMLIMSFVIVIFSYVTLS